MSDFRPPYIPEMEVQELPNSACARFRRWQVASKSLVKTRAGQLSVLRSKLLGNYIRTRGILLTISLALEEAHQSHTKFGL